MADDKKISELAVAGALTGAETLEVVQGGVNKKTTTQDIANLGGGGGGIVETIVAGSNITVDDTDPANPIVSASGGGGSGTVESVTGDGVDNTDPDNPVITILDSATPSTAGGTITLDMDSKVQRIFVGSASFATPKTIAMSNTTNALVFNLFVNVTNLAAVLTVPADWFMSDLQFDGTEWTPPETGRYELGGSFDGTNWWVKIQGPFA